MHPLFSGRDRGLRLSREREHKRPNGWPGGREAPWRDIVGDPQSLRWLEIMETQVGKCTFFLQTFYLENVCYRIVTSIKIKASRGQALQ